MLLELSSLSNILFQRKHSQKIAKAVFLFFIGLLLWMILDLLNVFHLGMHAIPQDRLSSRETTDLARIHLFGQSNLVDPNYLPETNENFTLNGLFINHFEPYSQAIITISGRQKVYVVGDELSPDIKITQILPNKVVLQHNGRLEALSMGRMPLAFANPPQGLSGLQ